jgi:hypothetical protein
MAVTATAGDSKFLYLGTGGSWTLANITFPPDWGNILYVRGSGSGKLLVVTFWTGGALISLDGGNTWASQVFDKSIPAPLAVSSDGSFIIAADYLSNKMYTIVTPGASATNAPAAGPAANSNTTGLTGAGWSL